MRRSRWSAFVVAVGLMAGCSGADDPDATSPASTPADSERPSEATSAGTATTRPETNASAAAPVAPWGEGALTWLDALEAAAVNGLVHLRSFIAADLVWESRLDPLLIHGSDSWFEFFDEEDLLATFLPQGGADYFVSADEVIGHRVIWFNLPRSASFLDRMEIGPDGLRHWIRSGSIDAGRWYDFRRTDFDAVEVLADRYVSVWNGSPDVAAASLYDPDAVVSDTLLGESVSGLVAIEGSVDSGSWPVIGHMSIVELEHAAGRAVHIAPSDADGMGPEEVIMLLDVDDGTNCPGRMVVALRLDGDRVVREHRFHDIESVRRCHDSASLQPGWWDGLEIPPPVFRERTGTLTAGDMTIEIFNGSPELTAFVEWGVARFEGAGLGAPDIASVTFLEAQTTCYNLGGTAQSSDRGAKITLCRTIDDVCVDEECATWGARHRQLLLHEFAHPWLAERTDDAVRSEFLDLVELPRWWDRADPWEQRGVERAADAIAYGLMGDPVEIDPEFGATCEERIAGFRVLTGVEPVTICDP